jgi:uncharacterized membrane protein (DUF2068 family)
VSSLQPKQQTPGTGKSIGATTPSRGLRLIAAFKLFKGLVLFAVGIGAIKLLHKDVASEVESWADLFRVDPDNLYFQHLLEKFSVLDDHKLRQLSVGTFFYSALLLTEGIGLLLAKRWAEYFTIIVTSSFIPLEIYEITKRVSWAKLVVLILNILVVFYLVIELRRKREIR